MKKLLSLFATSCLVLLTSCGENDPSMPLKSFSMISMFDFYEITKDSKKDDLTFARCSALLSVYSYPMAAAHESNPKRFPDAKEKSERARKIMWQFRMINIKYYPDSIYKEDKFEEYFESLGQDKFTELVLNDSNYCGAQTAEARIKYKII